MVALADVAGVLAAGCDGEVVDEIVVPAGASARHPDGEDQHTGAIGIVGDTEIGFVSIGMWRDNWVFGSIWG